MKFRELLELYEAMDLPVARASRPQYFPIWALIGIRLIGIAGSGLGLCLLVASATRLAAVSGDESWDDRFLTPGGVAFSPLAGDGTNVYAGGAFSLTNGVQNIARWNGRSWSALGAGITNGTVSTIAVSGSDVYVGGRFTNAGGLTVNHIAKWDGNSWSALGTGVTNAFGTGGSLIFAIAVDGGNVYVGGNFTSAGGMSATNIAKWDGSGWSSLDTGLTRTDNGGYVLALAMAGRDLYAGGRFMIAGGLGATNIAKWDGANWAPLGSGAGVASGFALSDYDRVYALVANGNTVFVGGNFLTAGGLRVNNIAQWDGTSWSSLNSGVSGDGTVQTLAIKGNDLYVGGVFSAAGGVTATGLAKWNGKWSAFGTGLALNSHIYAVAVSGTDVYIGGGITTIGGVTVNDVAKWDGTTWSALGAGLNNSVNAIAISGSKVYAGGRFTMASGLDITNIARWDGSVWSALGAGVNGSIRVMGANDTNLYVGGDFTQAGSLNVSHIAKWDGNNWSALGSGVGAGVVALAVSGNEVYVGGFVTTAGGADVANIAKWDGVEWSGPGAGVSPPGLAGIVSGIAVSGTDVYIGGGFTSAGGVATPSGVAKWDGSRWSALGTGLSDYAAAMAFMGNDLYVTGTFGAAGGINASHIARWAGTSWLNLGSGLSGAGQALAVGGADLYVGGAFTRAGLLPSSYFGIWHRPKARATVAVEPNGDRLLTWSSEPGRDYQVLSTTDLSKPFTASSGIITSQGTITGYRETTARGIEQFYEIEELP